MVNDLIVRIFPIAPGQAESSLPSASEAIGYDFRSDWKSSNCKVSNTSHI
jgi:hypothetical protein